MTTPKLSVHPSISWQKFDDSHLQIRVPDGQHITLTERASEVEAILDKLTQPHSYNATLSWAAEENIERDILDSALNTLNEYSIVVENEENASHKQDGIFVNSLDFNVNSSKAFRAALPFPYFNKIEVAGEGKIKQCVEKISRSVIDDIPDAEVDTATRTLRIVCSYEGKQQLIKQQNASAVEEKVALLAVQWADEYLTVGPLYIPGESACYECLNVRKRASTSFLAELDGVIKAPVKRAGKVQLDPFIENLIVYAVGRYLSIVCRGMFHLIKPNEVESWDIVKAERTVGEVLKVPRCDACGRKKSTDPVRAFRDLNS